MDNTSRIRQHQGNPYFRNLSPIASIEQLGVYVLKLTLENGKVITKDFEPILRQRAMYKPLLKPENFKKYYLRSGSIVWKGNRLDLFFGHLPA